MSNPFLTTAPSNPFTGTPNNAAVGLLGGNPAIAASTPRAATPLGIASNTILGLPAATVKVATDIGQGIARSAASTGLTIAKPLGGVDQLQASDMKSPAAQTLFKSFFGKEPVKSIEDRIAQAEIAIKQSPMAQKIGADKIALPLAFGGVFGSTALDLTPFGGLEKNAGKALLKETTVEGTAKILQSMKVPEDVAAKFAPHFAEAATPAQVQDTFDILKATVGVKARTEAINASKGVVEGDARATLANAEEKAGIAPTLPETERPLASAAKPPTDIQLSGKSTGEVASTEARANQALAKLPEEHQKQVPSLETIITRSPHDVRGKVNALDYLRTPDRVLAKIGFDKEAKTLREGYEAYVKELPKNIDKISEWAKQVPKEADQKIFQFLDGKDVALTNTEAKVAGEIKGWLKDWADRLGLPADNRITNYITHIFDKELLAKEFDEDLAKIITDKLPGSVYDPFLESRLGARGYKESTWEALDAYVKRATRKVNMDDALDAIQRKAGPSLEMSNVEVSQFKYLQRYVSQINMRPTELDNLLDNSIKSLVGYKYGQRPVTYLTKLLRKMTYRGMLGLNPGSALRNLSQGINTYAVLGERYTATGYMKLFNRGAMKELESEGVLLPGFIQDRTLSSTKKAMEKIDKGLFAFFDGAEKVNRGAAYFGAKAKALKAGKTETEAIEYAKSIVRKTQFSFGSIDTPVALQSDIVKTLAQFQNYTVKQTEFLTEMAKDKNFVGLLRYGVAGLAFVYTIGKAFGMDPSELLPSFRFGTPPSLKLPTEVVKAALDTPDKFGNQRSLARKASDIGATTVGLIPAGNQIKKTVQGLSAYSKGKDTTPTGKTRFTIPRSPTNLVRTTVFGKSSLPQAKTYYNSLGKKKPAASSNPFLQ